MEPSNPEENFFIQDLKEMVRINEEKCQLKEKQLIDLEKKYNVIKLKLMSIKEKRGDKNDNSADSSSSQDSLIKGKLILLRNQLEESRATVENKDKENRELLKTISELENKIKSNVFKVVANGDLITPLSSVPSNDNHQLKATYEQIASKDKHIEKLNQNCAEMEHQVVKLNESLKEKDEIIIARNTAVKALMNQFSSVNQNEKLNSNYNNDANYEQLKVDKISLEKELNQIKADLGSKVCELQKERDNLKAEKDKLKAKVNQMIKQSENTQLTCDELESVRERLKCELNDLKINFDKLEANHVTVNNQLSEVKVKLSQEEVKSESLEKKMVSLCKELKEKSNEVDSVHQQITDLALKSKTLLCEKDSIINDLENELNQKKNATFSEADEIVEELKQELKEKETIINSLQQNNLIQKNQLSTLLQNDEELNKCKTVIGQLQQKLDICEKELIKYKSLESELNYRVNELETENETLNEEQSKKQSELVNILNERDEFNEVVKKLNQEKDNAINRLKNLNHELDIVKHVNQKLEEEKGVLIRESRRLEETNQVLKENEEKNKLIQDQLKDMKKIEKIVIEKEEKIKELKQELKRLDNESSIEITNLNFKMKSEVDDLKEKLTLACLEMNSLEEEAKRKVQEVSEELQKAKQNETILKGQLSDMVKREKSLSDSVSQLQNKLSEERRQKDDFIQTCNNYEMSLVTQSQEYISKSSALELQIQRKDEQIQDLVSEKDALSKNHNQLQSELTKLQNRENQTMKDCEKQIEELKESNYQMDLIINKANEELIKVKSQLDQEIAAKKDIVQLNLNLDLIKKDKDHFYNLSEELKKEMEEERREFNLQLTQNQQSWSSIELQLKNRIQKLEKSESDLLETKSNYEQQLIQVRDELNQELKKAQSQIDQLKFALKSKSDEVEEKRLKIESVNQICDQFKSEIEHLTNQCKEIKITQDERIKVQREESDILIAELRKQIDDYQKELITNNNDHDKQVNLLNSQVRSLTNQLEEVRESQRKVNLMDTTKLETEILTLQQKCQEKSLKLSELEAFISTQSAHKLDQDQLTDYESKISELESIILNQRSEMESLKQAQGQQIEGLRSQISVITIQFEGEKNEWLLQKQLSTDQLNKADLELKRMRQDMLNLQQQLQLHQKQRQQQQQAPTEDEKKPIEFKEESELKLRCKRLAAKLKVKEREVNSLEEKLKEASKSNANILGYTNDDIIDRERELGELRKKVDQLKFTINNLDLALNKEREKRRACEEELESFWKKSKFTDFEDDSRIDIIDSDRCEPFALSRLSRARRWLRQKGLFCGSTGQLLKSNRKIIALIYILFIHILLIFKYLL